MNKSDIKNIYKKILLEKIPKVPKNDNQLNYIQSYIPLDFSVAILDAGCGNGSYAQTLVERGYVNITAVDLFEKLNLNNVNYITASIDDLPFKSDMFDFIYSNSVIYYLDNPADAIIEFSRVVKKGGILIITAHTKFSLFTFFRIIKRDIFKMKSMGHLTDTIFYSANYYKKNLLDNGFDIILQDGYRFSFLLYPIYYKFIYFIKKFLRIKLPIKSSYVTKNRIFGVIKSEISYHSVFIAIKK